MMRRAEKLTDWAISSEAPNRGTFNDYPRRGSRRKPKRQASRTDEDIVFPVVKAMGLRAANAVYNDDGTRATRIQGAQYTGGALYQTGVTAKVTTLATKIAHPLYHGGETITVYPRGAAYSGTLYYKVSDTMYQPVGSTMYYSAPSKTYTLIGDPYNGDLYTIDATAEVTKQGTEVTEKLYKQGKQYTGGLYSGFTKATISTTDVTALTV